MAEWTGSPGRTNYPRRINDLQALRYTVGFTVDEAAMIAATKKTEAGKCGPSEMPRPVYFVMSAQMLYSVHSTTMRVRIAPTFFMLLPLALRNTA